MYTPRHSVTIYADCLEQSVGHELLGLDYFIAVGRSTLYSIF